MAAPRNRRAKGEVSPRYLQPISPRGEAQLEDGGVDPAAAEVARLSNWTAKAGRPAAGPPPSSEEPDFDADAYAAEAAESLRQRFGLGPVTTRPQNLPPTSIKNSPARALSPTGSSDETGDDVSVLQAALAAKTRESERLQELLLAVTPAPGVNAAKLADIQV
jgi:hypothetical protein